MSGPWSFHLHVGAWIAVAVVATAVVAASRRWPGRSTSGPDARSSEPGHPRRWALVGGLAALAAAWTWPVADLAAHWSLTALLVQRLLLTLAAAPLLLLATPAEVVAHVTRPAAVDAVWARVTRPVTAGVIFAVVSIGSLAPAAVAAQTSSAIWRATFDVAMLGAGFVLWGPILRHLAGASRPAAVGLAVYAFVQSVVPTFPAVIYVLARHPFYPAFVHAHGVFGLAALTDQQVAGVVAKVATLPVLWSVAWVALDHVHRADRTGHDPDLLQWLDVERAFLRAERRQAAGRRPRHRSGIPRLPAPHTANPGDLPD